MLGLGKNNLFLCLCSVLPVDHRLDLESLVPLVLRPTETCESLTVIIIITLLIFSKTLFSVI